MEDQLTNMVTAVPLEAGEVGVTDIQTFRGFIRRNSGNTMRPWTGMPVIMRERRAVRKFFIVGNALSVEMTRKLGRDAASEAITFL